MLRGMFVGLALAVLLVAGCREAESPPVQLHINGIPLQTELAKTPKAMERGLMFRDQLAADSGMLFLFPEPKQASFWMRNTRIPLSIAYLDSKGRILEIRDMFPYDETPVTSYSSNVAYALEVNQGWFLKHNITPGMTVTGIPR